MEENKSLKLLILLCKQYESMDPFTKAILDSALENNEMPARTCRQRDRDAINKFLGTAFCEISTDTADEANLFRDVVEVTRY